jgi:hypothetical protein
MLHGTECGEIQLPCVAGLLGSDEFEGLAVALDVAGVEMAADRQRRRIGEAREQFAPRCRGSGRIEIRGRRPVQMRHLAGMMGDIAGEQACLAVRCDENAHVAGAVTGRRDQGDFVGQTMIARDEVDLAGLDDGSYGIVEHRDLVGLIGVIPPILVLGLAEHISRIGEGRQPFATDQPSVPADMIDMQVRAQHGVDAVGGKAGLCQGFEERALPVVPGRHVAAFLVVAEAGIDHDPPRGRLHHQRMDRHFEAAFLGGESRDQPRQLANFLVAGQRQDKTGAADGFKFDDLGDFDLADGPVHLTFPQASRHSGMRACAQTRNPNQHTLVLDSGSRQEARPGMTFSSTVCRGTRRRRAGCSGR